MAAMRDNGRQVTEGPVGTGGIVIAGEVGGALQLCSPGMLRAKVDLGQAGESWSPVAFLLR
jgi:hypothetical protein